MHLLLLADETIEAIEKYLYLSDVYSVWKDKEEIAVFCLYPVSETILEIKNIAVSPNYQNQQLGGFLLEQIKIQAKNQKYTHLLVGTSDTGSAQIRFYQRNGFIISGKCKNFFVENYPEPIIENGQQMIDMILFELIL